MRVKLSIQFNSLLGINYTAARVVLDSRVCVCVYVENNEEWLL